MEELAHQLLEGDAAEIRRLARRRQKNDRRDAELLLERLVHQQFQLCFATRERAGKYCRNCVTGTSW